MWGRTRGGRGAGRESLGAVAGCIGKFTSEVKKNGHGRVWVAAPGKNREGGIRAVHVVLVYSRTKRVDAWRRPRASCVSKGL